MKSEIEGFPLGTEGFPLGTEGFSVGIEGFPLGIEGFPLGIEGFPLGIEGFPLEIEGFPLEIEGFPLGIERFPLGIEGFPLGIEGFPLGIEGFPSVSREIPRNPPPKTLRPGIEPRSLHTEPGAVPAAPLQLSCESWGRSAPSGAHLAHFANFLKFAQKNEGKIGNFQQKSSRIFENFLKIFGKFSKIF